MGCIGIKRGIGLIALLGFILLLSFPIVDARFIQPDPVVQSRYNPQSLNHYSYTLNNPYKYIDPNGDVVVGYRGFTQSSGESYDSIGINDVIYNSQFEDPAQAFSVGFDTTEADVQEGYDFVMNALAENPNQRVVVTGYSLGGARATQLANKLGKEGVEVDLLVTIDPYQPNSLPGPPGIGSALRAVGGGRLTVGKNVKESLNIRQAGSIPVGGTLKGNNVKNVKVNSVPHTKIDDAQKETVRAKINTVPVQRNRATEPPKKESIIKRIISKIFK